MANPYTPPTQTSDGSVPQLTPFQYPAGTLTSTDKEKGYAATSVLLSDKLMVNITRGSIAPSSWFHAALPESDPGNDGLAPLAPAKDTEWEPDVMVDVKTLLGVGTGEDNGRFIAGLVAKEAIRKQIPVGGIVVGVGIRKIEQEDWESIVKMVQAVIPGK